MNLAEIRKKADEKRKAALSVDMAADAVLVPEIETPELQPIETENLELRLPETESTELLLPETEAPEMLFFEEPALEQVEIPVDDSPDAELRYETAAVFDTQSIEHYAPEADAAVYNVEHLPEPQPVVTIPAAAEETPAQAVSPASVYAPTARKVNVYNPLEIILSGREAATDSDDALFQANSYSSEEVEEYLCFRVAHEEYAISIMAIKEIVKPRDVTEVPRMPSFISGVISLRGVIIPVMDMRLRLSLPVNTATGRGRIIVLKRDTGFCGVLVDEVIQVARIKKSDIEEPPAVLDGIDRDFVTGLGHFDNRMLILLNLGSILDISVH